MSNAFEDFNNSKPIETVESNVSTELRTLEVLQVMLREDDQHKTKEGNPSTYLEIEVQDVNDENVNTLIRQYVYLTKDGALSNPARPSYEWNGETKPQTVIHEIMQRAKAYDPADYDVRKKETESKDGKSINWKKRLEGMKFEIECVGGDKKDGSGSFLIPQTDYQKARDAKRNSESGSMASMIPDTNNQEIVNPDDLPF